MKPIALRLRTPVRVVEDRQGLYLVGADGVVIAEAPQLTMESARAKTRDKANFKLIAKRLNDGDLTEKENE